MIAAALINSAAASARLQAMRYVAGRAMARALVEVGRNLKQKMGKDPLGAGVLQIDLASRSQKMTIRLDRRHQSRAAFGAAALQGAGMQDPGPLGTASVRASLRSNKESFVERVLGRPLAIRSIGLGAGNRYTGTQQTQRRLVLAEMKPEMAAAIRQALSEALGG